MAGITNFPTSLDSDSQLFDVTDGVSSLQAAHHNNMKEAIKAIQSKVGVNLTSVPTSLDYRLGNATGGHRHDGASGHGPKINATAVEDLAELISDQGLGGFAPITVIAELTSAVHAPPNMTDSIPFSSFYSQSWATNLGLAMPTRIGLGYTNVEFVALEAGVWAIGGQFDGATSYPTLGPNLRADFSYWGAYGPRRYFPTMGVRPLELGWDKVIAMATGEDFSFRISNSHLTATAPTAISYGAFDITRLSDRIE